MRGIIARRRRDPQNTPQMPKNKFIDAPHGACDDACMNCIIHTPSAPDWDDRGPWDFEPSAEALVEELVTHLRGECPLPCSYCFDEHEIRHYGIEGVNLYDDYMRELERKECTCA